MIILLFVVSSYQDGSPHSIQSVLGHIQRGGSPTSYDRILSSRLGMAAVEGLVNGEKNVMVGVVNDKVTFTSFKLAISKAKPINQELMRLVEILSI